MNSKSLKPKRGVVYLAFGRPYLAMALRSRISLAETNPELPACFITNLPVTKEDLPILGDKDIVQRVQGDVSENRNIKTSIIEHTPFDETFFVDCDTVVLSSLDTGFEFLRFFDICIRLNPYPQTRKGKADVQLFDDLTVGDCPHWNSGVVIFKNSIGAGQFFAEWEKNFRRIGNRYDQVSLAKTIFESPARFLSLDGRWNAVDPFIGRSPWRRTAKIFHYATNISDRLLKQIVKIDQEVLAGTLGAQNDETKECLIRRRNSKLQEHGVLKYLFLRFIWRLLPTI